MPGNQPCGYVPDDSWTPAGGDCQGQVGKVRFKFLNSYGGPNPGALEIQAFSRRLSKKEFAQLATQYGAQ